jgi:hypothetical protein
MRRLVPPKRRLTFNGLHGVASQKIETLERAISFSLFYFILFDSAFRVIHNLGYPPYPAVKPLERGHDTWYIHYNA